MEKKKITFTKVLERMIPEYLLYSLVIIAMYAIGY